MRERYYDLLEVSHADLKITTFDELEEAFLAITCSGEFCEAIRDWLQEKCGKGYGTSYFQVTGDDVGLGLVASVWWSEKKFDENFEPAFTEIFWFSDYPEANQLDFEQ